MCLTLGFMESNCCLQLWLVVKFLAQIRNREYEINGVETQAILRNLDRLNWKTLLVGLSTYVWLSTKFPAKKSSRIESKKQCSNFSKAY